MLSGHFPSKSFRRIKVWRVLYDLSRGAENVMSRLLSHHDDTSSSSHSPPPSSFSPLSASPFFVSARFSLLFPNCDVGLSQPALLHHGSRALYPAPLYNGATTERHPPLPPLSLSLPPFLVRRVNFLQIGILLQFASSSIILAPPRSPSPRPRSRLKLLFIPPLSIPHSSPRTLLT